MGFWVFVGIVCSALLIVGGFVRLMCVVCPYCQRGGNGYVSRYKWKKRALVHIQYNGFRDGWRTVREQVETDSTYFDNFGRQTGTSRGYSTVNRTVPCRTEYFTDFYTCPDCGCQWSKDRSHTYNL